MPQDSAIEIQVATVAQLFHTLDPFPFRERDLDSEAEEFIVGWARELPKTQPIRIIVHLPRAEAQTDRGAGLHQAINQYFSYRAEAATREMKELLRIGRYSLAIGLVVLGLCIAAGHAVVAYRGSELGQFVEEGLIILGWVANWRPIEIFLYDWWPILRRRRLLRRLAVADVVLAPR